MNRDEFMELVYETFVDEPDNVLANGIIEAADAYVEHEKAQLFSEGATPDLIDRQAALDIFDDYNVSVENGELEAYSRDRKRLCDLPPIQPEPTDINAKEAVYNLAEKIGIHQLFALTVELRGEPIQPEPHEGHWIDKGWDGDWAWQIDGHGNCWRVIECSECGKGVSVESNYCPHCGARMKGDANGKGN